MTTEPPASPHDWRGWYIDRINTQSAALREVTAKVDFREELLVEAQSRITALEAELVETRQDLAMRIGVMRVNTELLREIEPALEAVIAERDALRGAGEAVYQYAIQLEGASGAWFASRSYTKRPDGGKEAGERWRALTAPQPVEEGTQDG